MGRLAPGRHAAQAHGRQRISPWAGRPRWAWRTASAAPTTGTWRTAGDGADGGAVGAWVVTARPLRVLYVVGARPNFVKVAPVVAAGAAWNRACASHGVSFEQTLVHTGQHYDATLSDVFFDQLSLPEPEVLLRVGSGSQAVRTARLLEARLRSGDKQMPEEINRIVADICADAGARHAAPAVQRRRAAAAPGPGRWHGSRRTSRSCSRCTQGPGSRSMRSRATQGAPPRAPGCAWSIRSGSWSSWPS